MKTQTRKLRSHERPEAQCLWSAPLILLLSCTVLTLQASPAAAPDTQPAEEQALAAKAVSTLPSGRQLAWQQREITALVHFGPNTFTDREWGSGTEEAAVFNPARLDAAQWVAAAQAFGAKSLTLTCKHHDGFCLWPSQYTQHSVKRSPWKAGQGDLVREVSDACRKAGIGFGIYLSPADLNNPDYGLNSARYNDYFCNQLRELLTGYGEICEVFVDGAQPSIRHQGYDFPRSFQDASSSRQDAKTPRAPGP